MIKGNRDLDGYHREAKHGRNPRLLSTLLAVALMPAVLACGRPPRSDSPTTDLPRSAPAKVNDSSEEKLTAEEQALLKKGEEILRERQDCAITSLPDEVAALRRGVKTYVERPVYPNDPNRSKIAGYRAANVDILREEADKVKNFGAEQQARQLQLAYLALAKTDLNLSHDESGTTRIDLVDGAKCWFVKYISLGVILDDLRNQDRNNRRRLSWAPGIEV